MNNFRNRELNRHLLWQNSVMETILKDLLLNIIDSLENHKYDMLENFMEVTIYE